MSESKVRVGLKITPAWLKSRSTAAEAGSAQFYLRNNFFTIGYLSIVSVFPTGSFRNFSNSLSCGPALLFNMEKKSCLGHLLGDPSSLSTGETVDLRWIYNINRTLFQVEFMKKNMNCYPANETPTILPELLLADFCSSRSKVEIRSSIACSFSSSTIQESLNRG